VALTSNRQYFAMPERDTPETPYILLYRIGGSPDSFGQDYPQVILECWASGKQAKFDASTLGRVVAREVMGIRVPVLVGDAWVLAGEVNFGPVQTTGAPNAKRYRIDATFHIRSAM